VSSSTRKWRRCDCVPLHPQVVTSRPCTSTLKWGCRAASIHHTGVYKAWLPGLVSHSWVLSCRRCRQEYKNRMNLGLMRSIWLVYLCCLVAENRHVLFTNLSSSFPVETRQRRTYVPPSCYLPVLKSAYLGIALVWKWIKLRKEQAILKLF
jgi:hypothetical protein